MTTVTVVPGFSLTNRLLLYASLLLAPAQFVSGIANNCPSNFGFLAYNYYTQVQWYQAVKAKELHALSLLPVHFNFIYVITYLGGVSSGNIFMGIFLGLGTGGVIVLNTMSAWTSWVTNQPEGFGIYQFFFFGWRTLSPGWHKFILLWQIADSITALCSVISALSIGITVAVKKEESIDKAWYLNKYLMIPVGSALSLVVAWPLILWSELIVARNHIESATDMIAVWLFVAQAGALLVPSCATYMKCFRRAGKSEA